MNDRADNDALTMKYAAEAYQAAITRDIPKVQAAIMAISDIDGNMVHAMLGWVDTAHAELQRYGIAGHPEPGAVHLRFGRVGEDGEVRPETGADAVPPEHQWAGRWAAARIAGDQATCEALLEALPEDPHRLGVFVCTLALDMGLTVAAARRGEHPAQVGHRG